MVISHIVFFLCLVGAFYVLNFKVKFPADYDQIFGKPIPLVMVDGFLVVVFILWVLGLFGVGR